jgi:hypoxanthine phosphoribosyltransferase
MFVLKMGGDIAIVFNLKCMEIQWGRNMEFYKISWSRIESATTKVAEKVGDMGFGFVYGYPRGGLIPATILSHDLDMKFVDKPIANFTLYIDDIADTGETIKRDVADKQTVAVLFKRETCNVDCIYGEVVPDGVWLVFPWENKKKAKQDYIDYCKSRGITPKI